MAESDNLIDFTEMTNRVQQPFCDKAGEQSKVSHEENQQVLGLIMIILVKRAVKLLHNVTHSTIIKEVIVKC